MAKLPFALFNFASSDGQSGDSFIAQFQTVIAVYDAADVRTAFIEVLSYVRNGQYAAGFIAYEAAPAFDRAVQGRKQSARTPLLWFGIFRSPTWIAREDWLRRPIDEILASRIGAWAENDATINRDDHARDRRNLQLGQLKSFLDRDVYGKIFRAIKEHIRDGDTYQINFTFPLAGRMSGNPARLYRDLCLAQSSRYCAWLHDEEFDILSVSPELFFALCGNTITMKPMKGTRLREASGDHDDDIRRELSENAKDRAENVMIVDMIRNDLGRIAAAGAVKVEKLFDVETYPTVFQMTSTVTAALAPNRNLLDILEAVFPSGSVTGAPKIKTMELIDQYEHGPRGVYCGTIGYISPNGDAVFNVAIRTAVIRGDGTLTYAIGSGIVADSDEVLEYNECMAKSAVFKRVSEPDFELLETLLFRPKTGYFLLQRHLHRLNYSARFFGFSCDIGRVRDELTSRCAMWDRAMRVRLLVEANGAITVESTSLANDWPVQKPVVETASEAVDSGNAFLYHKTTNRSIYERIAGESPQADDVILYNERGEITESTIANIAVQIDGCWLTPPIRCGLLAGVMRAELLERGQIKEGVITTADLGRAGGIRLFNSVRGEYDVDLVDNATLSDARTRRTTR